MPNFSNLQARNKITNNNQKFWKEEIENKWNTKEKW